jgi:hypothetical protein
LTEKLRSVTKKPSLLRQKPLETQKFEMTRFGKGHLIGEVFACLPKLMEEDFFFSNIIQQAKMAFQNTDPIEVKCCSEKGELLRISLHEFFKKAMNHSKVEKMILEGVK